MDPKKNKTDYAEEKRSHWFMIWIMAVFLVMLAATNLLTLRVDRNVDALREEVHIVESASLRSEDAAIQSEAASLKAANDLAAALEASQADDGISRDQLREVFAVIFQIRDVVCAGRPTLCEETGG